MTTELRPRRGSGAHASARSRLLAAADELFYAEGVRSVGVDRVIEHAGVAKATLYAAFGSKDALVAAYLGARHRAIERRLTAAIARHRSPREQLLAIFDSQAEGFAAPTFHGCAFLGATAEAEPGGVVEQAAGEYRTWLRRLFVDGAARLGVRDPETTGQQLNLLYDGAVVSARMDRDPAVARATRAAAAALIDAAAR